MYQGSVVIIGEKELPQLISALGSNGYSVNALKPNAWAEAAEMDPNVVVVCDDGGSLDDLVILVGDLKSMFHGPIVAVGGGDEARRGFMMSWGVDVYLRPSESNPIELGARISAIGKHREPVLYTGGVRA